MGKDGGGSRGAGTACATTVRIPREDARRARRCLYGPRCKRGTVREERASAKQEPPQPPCGAPVPARHSYEQPAAPPSCVPLGPIPLRRCECVVNRHARPEARARPRRHLHNGVQLHCPRRRRPICPSPPVSRPPPGAPPAARSRTGRGRRRPLPSGGTSKSALHAFQPRGPPRKGGRARRREGRAPSLAWCGRAGRVVCSRGGRRRGAGAAARGTAPPAAGRCAAAEGRAGRQPLAAGRFLLPSRTGDGGAAAGS